MLHDGFISAVSKLVYFRIYGVYRIFSDTAVDDESADDHIRNVNADELADYQSDEYEMSQQFIRRALANGDRCFGFFADNKMVAYGWYASLPTFSPEGDKRTYFCDQYIYGYKEFTLEKFRGQGIQKKIKRYALHRVRQQGKKGVVLAIESQNFPSKKCTAALHGRVIGYRFVVRIFGRYYGLDTPGCKKVSYTVAG